MWCNSTVYVCMCQRQLPFPEGLGSRLYSCLYFASTSNELRLNFVWTSPQLRTNFAWKHNICAYRTYLCPNSTQLAETHSGKSIAQTMRTEAIGKDIDAGFHNDGAHNGRKDFKIPQQHYVIHTHFRHKETITRGTTSKLVERPVLPASSSWTILNSLSTCNTTHTYIYLHTCVYMYVCSVCAPLRHWLLYHAVRNSHTHSQNRFSVHMHVGETATSLVLPLSKTTHTKLSS